jgi:hypothetical protein
VDGRALPTDQRDVWLRSVVGFNDLNQFSYSFDGTSFKDFGGNYKLQTGNFRGDFVGNFSFNDDRDAGYVDVDFLHYEIDNR